MVGISLSLCAIFPVFNSHRTYQGRNSTAVIKDSCRQAVLLSDNPLRSFQQRLQSLSISDPSTGAILLLRVCCSWLPPPLREDSDQVFYQTGPPWPLSLKWLQRAPATPSLLRAALSFFTKFIIIDVGGGCVCVCMCAWGFCFIPAAAQGSTSVFTL